MIDRYTLAGAPYRFDSQAKLGAGSEGVVIGHPTDPALCVKFFHEPEEDDNGAASVAAYRERKVMAICASGLGLPPQFVLPQIPALDPSLHVIGYQMSRVPPGYSKLTKLLDAGFRQGSQMDLRRIMKLFGDIFDDLALVHKEGLVIGDVNLGCFMFQPGAGRAWVDTDSWSYKGFPCLATTELFAHPDLYPNLLPGAKPVRPRAHHDRFAFLVALCMLAIPGAHPFRMGKHATVRGLQNRAESGITIFDPDVTFPAALGSPEILSDDVLHAIVERLKRRTNDALNPELLRAFAQHITTCTKCGAEYSATRKHCPTCHETTVVSMPGLVDFLFEELFKTNGTLLFAQLVDTNLFLACRVGSKVEIIRVDVQGKATVLTPSLPSVPGARYRFFGNTVVVCPNPSMAAPAVLELYRMEGDTLRRVQDASTGVLEGETAVFDTTSRFLYRTAGSSLLRTELFGANGTIFDTPVSEVHQRQSWFTTDHTTGADREVIFGYDRALRNWDWFVIHGNAKGSHYQYTQVGDLGLRTGETVNDFAVYFSASSVLLVMKTSLQGKDYVRYAVIGLDGIVHTSKAIDASDPSFEHWDNIRGKLYQGKSVLHVTTHGIVKQQLSDGSLATLSGTERAISADDQLIRLGGKVGIVRRSGVLAMTNKKSP